MRGGRRAGEGDQRRRAGEQDSYATELNGTSDGTACLCREHGQTIGDDEEGFYGVLQLRRGSDPPRSYVARSVARTPTPWRTPLHPCSSLKILIAHALLREMGMSLSFGLLPRNL
ncbi:uncharacterized protein LOC119294983 isoform X1 [Triticum dicoccoides]|uniref:uncharacterized protein LOC119294983 isoform X1 n=1 Tax=Triticum dicoccoides TaxID=85692 RepID=UPI00188F79FE|nr:uncharacterized protein LOC119294983 isoform X1 [Triticum dicoccoides]